MAGGHRRSTFAWRATLVGSHLALATLVVFEAAWRIGLPDAASDEYAYRHCGTLYIRHAAIGCNVEHPPLAKELLGLATTWFGDSIGTARGVVAVAAIATAAFLYLFARAVAGWVWGLVAGALWGLLPQAGVENGVSLEAIRIDRFALLDPFVACWFAAALFIGWRWLERGGWWRAALTGAACAAAACSKVPGMWTAPVLMGAPLVVRWRRSGVRPALAEGGAALGGVALVVVLAYAPFGAHGSYDAIHRMIEFQSTHSAIGTSSVFGHHFYLHEPWWSGLGYALMGLSRPVAVALALAVVAALVLGRPAGLLSPALFALGASVSVWAFIALGTHLSLPYYWIDWEPGVVAAAALGMAALFRTARLFAAGLALSVPLAIAAVSTVVAVATCTIGPYQEAARAVACGRCQVLYVADGSILAEYLGTHRTWQARAAPRGDMLSSKTGNLVVPLPGRRPGSSRPQYVVVDPASDFASFLLPGDVTLFERDAAAAGYERVAVKGRLLVWKLR